MRAAYPALFTPAKEGGFSVYVPDFDINTQGDDLAHAIAMARDAIGLIGVDMEDDKKVLPKPSDPAGLDRGQGGIVTLVDVDFAEYRRKNDMRTVRRNVSLPSWLNAEAEKAGLNVSALLQNALKEELHLQGRR